MKQLRKIDIWILDCIFQKIADWIWQQVSISCFLLARILIIIACFLRMEFRLFDFVMELCFTILFFAMSFIAIRMAENRTREKFVNPFRYIMSNVRIYVTLFSIALFLQFELWTFHLLPEIFGFYFASCQRNSRTERRFMLPILVKS
jgi:hypothetical protein